MLVACEVAPIRNEPIFVSVWFAPIVNLLGVAADELAMLIPLTTSLAPNVMALFVPPVLPMSRAPLLVNPVLMVWTRPPPEFTATAPVKLTLLPLSVNADAPLLNVKPAKVVPAPKSLLSPVMVELPKKSASPGAAAPEAPLPPTQFGAFQKLPAGAALQVALAPWAERFSPMTEAAAAARSSVRFIVTSRRLFCA